eukprot:gene9383-10363_t
MDPAALQGLSASIDQIENEISDLLKIQAAWVSDEQLNFTQFRETINALKILFSLHAANYPVNTLNQIGVLLRSIEQLLYNYNHANDPPDLNQTIINDYTTRLNELRAELVGVPDNHLQGEFAEVHADKINNYLNDLWANRYVYINHLYELYGNLVGVHGKRILWIILAVFIVTCFSQFSFVTYVRTPVDKDVVVVPLQKVEINGMPGGMPGNAITL